MLAGVRSKSDGDIDKIAMAGVGVVATPIPSHRLETEAKGLPSADQSGLERILSPYTTGEGNCGPANPKRLFWEPVGLWINVHIRPYKLVVSACRLVVIVISIP